MTGNTLRDDLQRQIDRGSVVAIVGAGVSVGATNGSPVASWQGLLHHGVERCLELPTTGMTEAGARLLHAQIDSGDVDMMLAAAEVVSSKLGAPGGGEWGRWLRESVGQLRAEQREVIEALRDLGVTLATTNYDGLLEEVTGLPPVTWRDGAIVERVLRGEEKGILHLHGFWRDPESVVLGVRDYQRVLGDAPAQAMQKAMRSLNTLLFVGCGEGLADPNFGALLRWSESVFAGSEYRHFRLARDGEVGELQAKHPEEQRLFVLGYGPDYGDLAGFLRGLRRTAIPPGPAPAPAPAPAAALPPAPLCLGRDAEVEDLVATLLAARPEPVAILGPAGIGKSTLTLVALNDPHVAERYGARRFFVRCDAVRTREAFAAAVATALGLPVGPQVEAALLAELRSAPAALAIDNAETPWEADTLRMEELLAQLAALPGLALVASLRGYSQPLGVQWRQAIQPRSLPLSDARNVFLAIAGQQFANDPDLDRLLLALDGVPLAITLMANAAQGQPDLADTRKLWETERTRMLRRADAKDRLANIEASYKISIQGPRMTDEARRLLSLLGFLPGGVARGDIDAILPDYGTRAATVLRQVGLAFDEAGRLRLLAPLREYVHREHPPQPGDLQAALSHYVELGTSLGEKVGREGGAEAIARLTPDIENIETAVVRALDSSESGTALRAAVSLGAFALYTGLGTPVPLENAVVIADSQQAYNLAAECRFQLGSIAFARSNHEGARTRYEEALPLYKHVGNIDGEADCIKSLGEIALRRSDHESARTSNEEAIALYRSVGNILGEANCIRSLGDIALAQSEPESAQARYEEALPLYRRVGDVLGEANCIFRMGDIALNRSDHERARTGYEDALPLYMRVGDTLGEANCITRLGDLALERSDYESAHTRYGEALLLYRRISSIRGEANCIKGLGDLALAQSNPESAQKRYEEALPLYRRVGDILGEANCIIGMGDIALARTDYESAHMRYEEALPLYRRIGDIFGEANCIIGLGDIALAQSDPETARAKYEEGLALYERIPEPYSTGRSHRRLARIALDETQRRHHVHAAKHAWQSIGRNDLVESLMDEFGGE